MYLFLLIPLQVSRDWYHLSTNDESLYKFLRLMQHSYFETRVPSFEIQAPFFEKWIRKPKSYKIFIIYFFIDFSQSLPILRDSGQHVIFIQQNYVTVNYKRNKGRITNIFHQVYCFYFDVVHSSSSFRSKWWRWHFAESTAWLLPLT